MGRFDGAFEAREMAIDSITEGISKAGMETLLENMQAKLLVGVQDQLSQTGEIVDAIKAGWQGKSRDAFLNSFDASINSIVNDLSAEYTNLVARMRELAANYYDQDSNMMNIIEK